MNTAKVGHELPADALLAPDRDQVAEQVLTGIFIGIDDDQRPRRQAKVAGSGDINVMRLPTDFGAAEGFGRIQLEGVHRPVAEHDRILAEKFEEGLVPADFE